VALLLFVFYSLTSVAWPYDFWSSEFKEISCVVERILTRYPPDRFIILGLGRSPTPLTAYLQASDLERAISATSSTRVASLVGMLATSTFNLPLSNFRYGRKEYPPLTDLKRLEILYSHFDRYIPESKYTESRNFLLIDFCQSGNSLMAASDYVTRYLRLRGREETVTPLCIQAFNRGGQADVVRISRDTFLYQAMMDQDYDYFSEFGKFDITDGKELNRSAEYVHFLDTMLRTRKNNHAIILACQKAAHLASDKTPPERIIGFVKNSASQVKMNPPLAPGQYLNVQDIADVVAKAAAQNEKRIRQRDAVRKSFPLF
jgi:hypothetical protein